MNEKVHFSQIYFELKEKYHFIKFYTYRVFYTVLTKFLGTNNYD